MNAPGLFPIVGNGGESLKQRLEHVLAGLRSSPQIGRRWIAATTLLALAAIAGIGFAQQGKRAPAASPEPASNPEVANGTKPEASQAPQKPAPQKPVPPRDVSKPESSTTIRQVRGRVLLPNGQPALGATVRAIKSTFRRSERRRELLTILATFATDSKGEFAGQVDVGPLKDRQDSVHLWATLPGYGLALHQLVSTEKNDPIALHLVDDEREMPDPATTKVNTSQRDESTIARGTVPASSDQAVQNVSGLIVNEKGEPLAGARVAVIARLKRTRRGGDLGDSPSILAEAATEAGGRFRLSTPRIPSTEVWFSKLIARGDGYGLAGRDLRTDVDSLDVKLTLPPEQALRGRFVDLQGQPVAGVRARVQSILPTRKGQFSDRIGFPAAGPEPAAWPGDCVSDAAGRFVIQGVGVGQGVSLFIDGSEKLAPQSVTINSGQSERREASDATYRPQAVANLKSGEEGVFPLAPAQFFEGTVRFADTKQPAPNARLTIYASQQEFGGSFLGLNGQADAQGHFRINANPGVFFQITAYPPDGAAYLTRQVTAHSKSGESQGNVIVDLPRGVLVRGRIVNSADDRPIPHCSIQYVPTSSATRRAPAGVMTGWQAIELSDPRGEFAIPVLSGLGHLLVYGPTPDYVYQEAGDRELSEGHPGGRRNYAHAISRIDPPNDATSPIDLTIKLKRGATVSGRLLTPDGQPVEETLLISRLQINPLSPTWRGNTAEFVRGGRFAVSGCGPGVECPLYFLDPQHQTGATARVENNSASQGPLTVRLAICGAAKARFVDSEGKPIADLEPSLHLVVTPGPSPFDRSPAARGQLSADEDFASNVDRKNQLPFPKAGADGVATFRVLIPGATYRLVGGRNRELAVLKEFSAEAGKTLDLGDVVADRPRER